MNKKKGGGQGIMDPPWMVIPRQQLCLEVVSLRNGGNLKNLELVSCLISKFMHGDPPPNHQPLELDQMVFFRSLICIGALRNPAASSTHYVD